MMGPPPPGGAVRAAAVRLVAGWLRRYRSVAIGAVAFIVVVVALPSTSPDGGEPVPSTFAVGPVVRGDALNPVPATEVPLPFPLPSDVVAPPAPVPAEPDDTINAPKPPEAPPIPGAPACPLALPPAEPPPAGVPQLLQFLPLVGPFGPEALGGLPLLGHFLTVVTPLLPLFQPGLDAGQPTMDEVLPLIIELEAIVLAPAVPFIEEQTPQWLEYERQLVQFLEPLAVMTTDNPAVTCVVQLEVLAVAALAQRSEGQP
jgi:hypothetical protein